MQIVISGIPIDVQKKNIKNMHLQVKPPDGHVVISAPLSIDDKAIEVYARTNLSWIKRQIQKYEAQPRSSKRQYISGETMYIWGKQYFLKFVADGQKNGFIIQGDQVILSMNKDSTVKQRESYVREQYRLMLKREIERLLPKWENLTDLHCDSWQTKYMITRWGTCNTEKKKLWFNLQLAQKPIECLEYVILHELIHLRERKHNSEFITYMDMYMPNWREVRKDLNDRKLDYYDAQDESPLKKLIDRDRYDEIKDAVIKFLENDEDIKNKKASPSDVTIENVVRIEQPEEGIIQFDVITCCDVEKAPLKGKNNIHGFVEHWVCARCQVLQGIELTDFKVVDVMPCEPQEESENDRFSGELVPILSRDDFEKEAEAFLTKYCPEALEKPIMVPIRKIAEQDMHLTIAEDVQLASQLSCFGMIVFEDGNIQAQKSKKIVIRNAKRGTVYIDPEVGFERTLGSLNNTLAHECYHWYRHQPYHALMKMIDSDDDIGRNIQCSIATNTKESESWKAIDWMEWQANGVAMKILMPEKTTRVVIENLLKENNVSGNNYNPEVLENIICTLSETYGVSKQAAKIRMLELGYKAADGACTYVDGRAIRAYAFNADEIDNKQSFTISSADLFKAYSLNKRFRDIIKTGCFAYVENHLCLNDAKYIQTDGNGVYQLTDYAISHMDECCLTFELGFSYESKYQGIKNYNLLMFKSAAQAAGAEYTFDMNDHNRTVLAVMDAASKSASRIRKLPGGFGESLSTIMKSKKINGKTLSTRSLVGEKTIQRIKNEEGYVTTKQAILGLCVGLELPPIESRALFNKSDFKLSETNSQDIIYMCVLDTCPHTNIYEINEMLKARNVPQLGSRPDAFE